MKTFISLILFYLPMFLITAFSTVAAQEMLDEEKISSLAEQAKALNNLGEEDQAETIYLQLLQEPELPLDISLDYLDLLVKQLRYREAAQFLKYRPIRPTSDNLKNRYAFKQAELLVAQGKYQEATHWIKDYQNLFGNRVYSAYFYMMANDLLKTTELLDQVKDNIQYTPHEQKEANWLRMDMERFWHRRISSSMKLIHNPAYGSLHPVTNELKYPINKNWGKLTLRHYTLDGKQQLGLNLAKVVGFKDKMQLGILYSDTKLGLKGGWQQRRGNYQIGIKGYYHDVENDVTALLKDFALKDGAEISGYYKQGRKLILGGSYTYNRFFLPDDKYIGEIHTFHPNIVYIPKDKSPTLQHGIGWLHIDGEGDTNYIPHKFDMAYYAISGLYYFGFNKSMINYSLSLGYMQGDNFQGFAMTPKINLRYNITKDLDLLGEIEYRKDSLTGGGETRANLNLNWRF